VVKGLDVFRGHFAGYEDQYVLIGGTAATLAMAEAGLEFRATTDLDIVLHREGLTPAFGAAVWAFVEQGAYEIRQASETGRPVLYRFQKPASAGFPAMIELFCRAPEGIQIAPGAHLAPISFDEVAQGRSDSERENRIAQNQGGVSAMDKKLFKRLADSTWSCE
jgi:hypothetical protein